VRGKLLGLQWRAVDLEQGAIQVRVTLRRTAEGITTTETKTAHSRRRLILTPLAIDALRRYRAHQLEERLAAGAVWEDHDLVLPNTIGRPMEASNFVYREYLPLLKKAGLPRIRFHDLRHTAATLLLLQKVNPKVVSEMLGHSSVAITLDLYSHVLPDMQQEAMEAMSRLLDGQEETVVKTVVRRRKNEEAQRHE
jgi:integrase